MSPAGRPPLSGERKDDQVRVRLTADEKALIDAAAALDGKVTTVWVRDLALATAAERTAKPAPKKKAAKKAGQ